MAKAKDDKGKKLEAAMKAAAEKHGKNSSQYLKARGAYNDYQESLGQNVNRIKGEPIGTGSNTTRPTPTPVTPEPNPGPDNTTTSGLQPTVVGNPTANEKKSDLDKLFGDFSGQAGAADNLYTQITPLTQLDPALSQHQTNALNIQQTTANQALQRDPRQEQMLDMFLKNAQQGMSQPELVALQEEGQQGINSQLQGVLRQLTLRNAGSGISGPAQTIGQNPAIQQSLQAQRDLQRDMITKNMDFRQQNLQQGFNAANTANNSYFSNLSTAGKDFWASAAAGANQVLGTQKYNAEQQQNYAAGRLGSMVGGADWGSQQHFANEANELAGKAIEASKAAPGGGMGGGQAAGYSGSSLGESWKKGGGSGSTGATQY